MYTRCSFGHTCCRPACPLEVFQLIIFSSIHSFRVESAQQYLPRQIPNLFFSKPDEDEEEEEEEEETDEVKPISLRRKFEKPFMGVWNAKEMDKRETEPSFAEDKGVNHFADNP